MRLFFAICDNGLGLSRTSWAISLAAACHSVLRGHDLTFRGISYPYPDGSTNIAAAEFLATDCEEMILIDTDVIFSPKHLGWLMEHQEPLVFGAYPKKVPGLYFPRELLSDENPFSHNPFMPGVNPLVEVKCTARGFMRLHRSVLERMAPTVPEVEFFKTGVGTMREFWKNRPGGHSDDFNFCDQWRALGGRVLIDQRITAQHEGSAVFPIPGTF